MKADTPKLFVNFFGSTNRFDLRKLVVIKIRLIQIERNNKAEEIKAFLFERGYAWMEDLGEDAIYVTNEEAGKYQIP